MLVHTGTEIAVDNSSRLLHASIMNHGIVDLTILETINNRASKNIQPLFRKDVARSDEIPGNVLRRRLPLFHPDSDPALSLHNCVNRVNDESYHHSCDVRKKTCSQHLTYGANSRCSCGIALGRCA